MIKVSVIVPVYNAEKYLRKCMDSLVGQTLEDIEIIAVNDGSADSSLSILSRYEAAYPDKVRVLTKPNGGQASARNLALRCARGAYIGYVDADDYADRDMFRAMAEEADRTGAALTVCDHFRVEGDRQKYVRFPDYASPREMLGGVLVSPWNKLLRREVLVNSGVVFPEGYIYEDTAWFAELIPFISSMAWVHRPLLYHVVQPNSTMTAAQGQRTAQIFPVMNGVVEFYRERGLYDAYEKELSGFYARILLLSSMRRIAEIKDGALRRKLEAQTLRELNEHFPDFRGTCRETGWRGLYIRHAGPVTVRVFVWAVKAFL